MASAARAHLADFTVTRRVIPIAVIACAIGALCAVVALALLRLIALCTNIFYYGSFSFGAATPVGNHLGAWAVLLPAAGGLLVGFMARFGSDRIRGHGIPEAIEAILTRGSRVDLRVALLKPISAAVSIGSGGPFGAEGPIIMTGGAFGSLIAQRFHLTSAERKTLLVAGAAAGMSATFGAPIASALLAVELLLFEWKPRSLIPVAAASATAAALRPLVLGPGPLFPTAPLPAPPGGLTLAACVPVGLAAGALAALMAHAVWTAENAFERLPIPWMWWPAIGGLVVGLGGLISPHALGVGYDVIADLLAGSLVLRVAAALAIVKALIWAVALGSGTSGGVLAPLLIIGAGMGSLLAPLLPAAGVAFWPLIGMAGILGGAMGVPFTAVVFALELTHDVNMLLPLMIAVMAANAFTSLALRRSILTEKIDRRGFHLSREYATDPLELLFVRDVMTPADGDTVREPGTYATHPNDPLTHAVNRMAERGCTTLVVTPRGHPEQVVGHVSLDQLLAARGRHLEEERQRDGSVPLTAFMPPWLRR